MDNLNGRGSALSRESATLMKKKARLTCSRIEEKIYDDQFDISNVITSNKINSVCVVLYSHE